VNTALPDLNLFHDGFKPWLVVLNDGLIITTVIKFVPKLSKKIIKNEKTHAEIECMLKLPSCESNGFPAMRN
jgi:hypothetical protein